MTVTTTSLTRAAGVAAAAAGAIFIGVQIGHPQLNLTSITDDGRLRPGLLQGPDVRAGRGRHHRHVPEPGPPQRSPRTRRLPGVRRGLPLDHVHHLPRRLRRADPRRHQSGLRQGRHRPGHQPRHRHRRRRSSGYGVEGPGRPLPGRRRPLRHRALPRPRPRPLGDRAPRGQRPRQRRALTDARRLLPAAGLPERHRDDRSRRLPLAQPARGLLRRDQLRPDQLVRTSPSAADVATVR